MLTRNGIELNIINNYKKGLNRSNYIVNIDFTEDQIKKYNIYYKAIFINLNNKYEITNNHFARNSYIANTLFNMLILSGDLHLDDILNTHLLYLRDKLVVVI